MHAALLPAAALLTAGQPAVLALPSNIPPAAQRASDPWPSLLCRLYVPTALPLALSPLLACAPSGLVFGLSW